MFHWTTIRKDKNGHDLEFGVKFWNQGKLWHFGSVWFGKWGISWYRIPKDNPHYHSRSGE